MQKPKVYFRADGNSTIGLGHVYRSLALMTMLDDFFHCFFIIKNPNENIRQLISNQDADLISLEDEIDFRSEAVSLKEQHLNEGDIFVIDGYNFDEVYKNSIKESGVKLICIDDLYDHHVGTDLIINHGGEASRGKYKQSKNTQYALGPKYALLRPPFWQYAKSNSQVGTKNKNLFICFGGADPENQTLKTLQSISHSDFEKCYVILGSSYQHRENLEKFIKTTELDVELLSNLSAEELVSIMSKCQSAISSPSTIAYEYLSIGGSLYLKQTADNQIHLYNYLVDQKLAFSYETFPVADEVLKAESVLLQKDIFDGLQSKRFNYLFKSLALNVRLANLSDKQLFFDWANEKLTRTQSFSQDAIPWKDHVNWFDKKVTSKNSLIFVLELKSKPIGQVRFDLTEENIIISFSLDKDYRGQGLGTAILHRGLIALQEEKNPNKIIIGYVRKENVPSQKAFKLLEFKEEETTAYQDSYQYIYNYGI